MSRKTWKTRFWESSADTAGFLFPMIPALALFALINFGICYSMGADEVRAKIRQKMVDRGLAEWRVSKEGEVSWIWTGPGDDPLKIDAR